MKCIATKAYSSGALALICLMALGVAGCTALQPKPRATVYDFGPGPVAAVATNRMAPLPTLVLADAEASAALDSTAVLYRLAYSDAQQLRPYQAARWSQPPIQLVRQSLQARLGLALDVGRAIHPLGQGKSRNRYITTD